MTKERRSRDGRAVRMHELDIPIFFIKRLGDRQFVVGGGGGSAKTGVPNAVYLFSLTIHNGRCYLRESQKLETGTAAPMNVAVYEITSSSLSPVAVDSPGLRLNRKLPTAKPSSSGGQPEPRAMPPLTHRLSTEVRTMLDTSRELVAIGLDNSSSIYQINRSLPKPTQSIDDEAFALSRVKPVVAKQDLLSIIFRETVRTIEGQPNIQQCCAFLPPDTNAAERRSSHGSDEQGSLPIEAGLVVGGTDGMLRFFRGENLQLAHSVKAHDDEVSDIDVSATGEEIVTGGRDKKVHVWSVASRKLITSAQPDFPQARSAAYRPRKVRFHSKEASVLFVVWIPVVREKKRKNHSFICVYKFRGTKLIMVKHTAMEGDLLSALAISPDGKYLATGNLDGNVSILRADSLAVIYSTTAHDTFVTDLEFADVTFGAKLLTGTENAQCTVFSVSADKKILLHQADFRYSSLKRWKKGIKWLALLWLFMVFVLRTLDYIGYIKLKTTEEFLTPYLDAEAAAAGSSHAAETLDEQQHFHNDP
ncbi:hypothetical protein RvY_04735 [Ramazzottius varieornatus]|uniref:Uncharacterized protein n=1 Tax=Ramazzottius varieornatus TaxID=947166 RepID=A0A1D1USN8_RAMVA|nr:hypothetical protein RvY_04735 [Ramazzottius varieornatus]